MRSALVLAALLAAAAEAARDEKKTGAWDPASLPHGALSSRNPGVVTFQLSDAPASWQAAIAAADMMFSPTDSAVAPNNMPMIGNGFVATQIATDSIYLSGLFNGYLTSGPSHRARVPATNNVPAPGTPGPAAIHLREATYLRRSFIEPSAEPCTLASTVSCVAGTAGVVVEQRWYAHRALPSLMVMEVQILPNGNASSSSSSSSSSSIGSGDALFAMLRLVNDPGSASGDLNLTAVPAPPGSPYSIALGSTQISETNTSGLQGVVVLTTTLPASGMLAVNASEASSTFAYLSVFRTTVETPADSLVQAATADYVNATQMLAAGTLWSSHVAEWALLWESGLEIDLNRIDVASATNSSLYSLLSSARTDRPLGISPGGALSAYNGHVFWDMSTWMFPGLLLLHPDIAVACLKYHVDRIPGAEEKAQSYSPPYAGTMFPWESAWTGVETCPSWAPTGTREIHISGDISYAATQLFWMTGDVTWLGSEGWPLLSGIADFWVSKAVASTPGAAVRGWPRSSTSSSSSASAAAADPTPLSILDVIPPDEYADHVNNSAYTNAVAVLSLQYAVAAAKLLGYAESVYAPWEDAYPRILLSMPFNATANVHPEFDGYAGQTVKQADTILLGYPLNVDFNMTPAVREADLLEYINRTDPNGPAMTWGMFAVGFIELGLWAQADANFNRSFANAIPPFFTWEETPQGGATNFLTGAGGFLQAVYAGFPALRMNATAVTLNPARLVEGAGAMVIRGMGYLGQRVDVALDAGGINVTVRAASNDAAEEGGRRRRRAYASQCAASGLTGCDEAAASRDSAQAAHELGLLPREPASARSQRDRVVLPGRSEPTTKQGLVVVDAGGAAHALTPGVTVRIAPLQQVAIMAAAAASAEEGRA
jgi:protein-glucosylgalactosylhydroxylysine glucosidase